MQRLRGEILARPRFAHDQHGAEVRRHTADPRKHLAHLRAAAYNSLEFGAGQQLVLELQRPLLAMRFLDQFAHAFAQSRDRDGLVPGNRW